MRRGLLTESLRRDCGEVCRACAARQHHNPTRARPGLSPNHLRAFGVGPKAPRTGPSQPCGNRPLTSQSLPRVPETGLGFPRTGQANAGAGRPGSPASGPGSRNRVRHSRNRPLPVPAPLLPETGRSRADPALPEQWQKTQTGPHRGSRKRRLTRRFLHVS